MLAVAGMTAVAGAMTLYYASANYSSAMQYTYIHIGGPGQMYPPIYMYTKPVTKLQNRSRDHYILLNYLRRTYDPHFWTFSLGDDLTDWGAWVAYRFQFNYNTDGIQGATHIFGFNSVLPPNYPRDKDFIYMERVFSGNTRIEIKTQGNPFQAWTPNTSVISRTYREVVGCPPSSQLLVNFNSQGKDYLGDLFVCDHYITYAPDGIHHSVIIYDGFDIHTAYRVGPFTSPPPRPNDPENGFLPPSGGSSGGITYLPRTASQPWTSTGADGTQTVYYANCQNGSYYPDPTTMPDVVLPCVDATNPPTETAPTPGTVDASQSTGISNAPLLLR